MNNRVDNTHATFLNCLRNWDDPYLHGSKPTKSIGCVRCESCGCRLNTNNDDSPILNTSGHQQAVELSSACSSSSENSSCNKSRLTSSFGSSLQLNSINQTTDCSHRHYLNDTYSNLNRNLNANKKQHVDLNKPQPLMRSKSTINVPKTINQCVSLAKSRPRPSSIRPRASASSGLLINDAACTHKRALKRSNTSGKLKLGSALELDSDLSECLSRHLDESKNLIQVLSDTSTTFSTNSSSKEVKSEGVTGFSLDNVKQHTDLTTFEMFDSNLLSEATQQTNLTTMMSFKSCSTSSLIENEHLIFEDSLQEDSFDSDR